MASTDFRSVKNKVRLSCKQRRIRLQEFMRPFDIHRQKKIKIEQFKRALDMSGLRLSRDEIDCILFKYRSTADSSFIEYQRFCDLIDKVFARKGLETRPQSNMSSHESVRPDGGIMLNETADNDLHDILKKLWALVVTKGIVFKDEYSDFDLKNSGCVTRAHFTRIILGLIPLSERELAILFRVYGKNQDVDYRSLHRNLMSIDKELDTSAVAKSFVVSPKNIEDSGILSISDLENRLTELAQRRRLRIKDHFADADSLRTGKCSSDQFRRSIKNCFSGISDWELGMLTQKYASSERNIIDYMRFVDRIDGKPMYEQDILTKFLCSKDSKSHANSGKKNQEINDGVRDTCRCEDLLRRLAMDCSSRRLLLRPAFQDFDRSHREYVTVEQFFRVIFSQRLVISSAEKNVLMKEYFSFYGDRYLNYAKFCSDIARYEPETSYGQAGASRPTSRGITSEILTPVRLSKTEGADAYCRSFAVLMIQLRSHILQHRIRIGEFLSDHDKLRHGLVTRSKFSCGINAVGFILSLKEMDVLSAPYASSVKDAQGKSLVNWKRFVADIESSSVINNLEHVPQREVVQSESAKCTQEKDQQHQILSVEEEAEVHAAITALREKIERDRLEIKYVLEDFDPLNKGTITPNNFERGLSMANILPKASLLRLYILKYGRVENGELGTKITAVDYRGFLRALRAEGDPISDGVPQKCELKSVQKKISEDNVMNLESVVASLQQQVAMKRVRLKDFICEGDKLRSGEITVSKFHTALNRSGFSLSGQDIATLTMQFRSSHNFDKIDWRSFLDAIDARPPTKVQDYLYCGEKVPYESIKNLLERLTHYVKSRRLEVKSQFQNYDRCRHNRVKKHQFSAVLDMMKFGLQPAEIDALSEYFSDRNDNQHTSNHEVNYLLFVRAIDADQR